MTMERELNYGPLLDALIKKSAEGKLEWHETADENTFIAAVKGEQTYVVSLQTRRLPFENANRPIYKLTAKDREGKVFLETPDAVLPKAQELFVLARRIARRSDQQLDAAVELLNNL